MSIPINTRYTSLQEYAAAQAWEKLYPEGPKPSGVMLLKKKNDSSMVFRIEGVNRGNGAVIAKRCIMATGLLERKIYEEALPQLPVTAPEYYGYLKEDEKYCWLFMEEVGQNRFSPFDQEHQLAAARWLGVMHSSAYKVLSSGFLPDRGPNYYLNRLRSARKVILENFDRPCLNDEDKIILKKIISQLDLLENNWQLISQFCSELPSTLVHGDFRPKNVFVGTGQNGLVLFPLDWELAGWGIPAPDLAPARRLPSYHQINLQEYWSIVSDGWPSLDMTKIERMARLGHIFRRLEALEWATLSLKYERPEKAVSQMSIYQAELAKSFQTEPWFC